MQMEMLVQSERSNSYVGKKGAVNEVILTLLDVSQPGISRLTHPIEFYLTDDAAKAQWANGKAIDKRVLVSIQKLRVWSGALRCEGSISAATK